MQTAFELRQAIHIAVLDAMMASRRWEPGELVFQGGTCLHLAHGSPRYSEDLDFMVRASLDLGRLPAALASRLGAASWLPEGLKLDVRRVREDRNPFQLDVVAEGPLGRAAARVRVEMWRTPAPVMSSIRAVVTPVRATSGAAAGIQTFVASATLPEILADKVFALAARRYLKARDVFDLYWLESYGRLAASDPEALRARFAAYPGVRPDDWVAQAEQRRKVMREPREQKRIAKELAQWLPSTWPVRDNEIREMVAVADRRLAEAQAQVSAMLRKQGPKGPAP